MPLNRISLPAKLKHNNIIAFDVQILDGQRLCMWPVYTTGRESARGFCLPGDVDGLTHVFRELLALATGQLAAMAIVNEATTTTVVPTNQGE